MISMLMTGDVGRNEEGDIVNTASEDSENVNMDGSSKDVVGEHIEEGEGVLVDGDDGEDNEGVDDGPVDNLCDRIGFRGGRDFHGVCGGHERGCSDTGGGRNNSINIEQWQCKKRGTVENNDTDILFTGVEKLNILVRNNSSPLDFFSYILHKNLLNY